MTEILDRIRKRLDALGLKAERASLNAGLPRGAIRGIENGYRRNPHYTPLPRNLAKLAVALKTSVEWLEWGKGEEEIRDGDAEAWGSRSTAGTAIDAAVTMPDPTTLPADVPVLGTAAGSAVGAFVMDGPIDWVRRPPGLARTRKVYALYVAGDSMAPMHRPGDLVFVSPDRPAIAGDVVIIQTRTHATAPIQCWIKMLVRRTPAELVARQINPDAEITYRMDQVVEVHRVLTMRELFAV